MKDKVKDIKRVVADERNLRILINSTDNPIWLVDGNCEIVECNQAFKKWVNHFIGTELDRGDNVLYHGKNKRYLEKFEMCYQLALSGSAFRTVEDMRVNDAILYTTVSFNPVFDRDKRVTGVSCFARDITEQRKHLAKIEQQNTTLREIAFIESHKLRGPLANIIGLLDLFNYEDFSAPLNIVLMEGIAQMSHELDAIIRDVVLRSNEMGL